MGEEIDCSSVNSCVSGDNSVTQYLLLIHAKITGLMDHEPVQFDKATRIDECANPLAGREFAFSVLFLDLVEAASKLRFFAPFTQLLHEVTHTQGCSAVEPGSYKSRNCNAKVPLL